VFWKILSSIRIELFCKTRDDGCKFEIATEMPTQKPIVNFGLWQIYLEELALKKASLTNSIVVLD